MKPERTYTVYESNDIDAALRWFEGYLLRCLPGGPVLIGLGRPKRSNDQNAKLWAMLTDLSMQVEWYGQHLTKDEWKDVMTAGLKKQKAVPGIDGGFVVIGAHTSQMNKAEMSNLIELIYSFGAEHGVDWSEEARKAA